MKIAIVCFNLQWQAGGTRLIYSLARMLGKVGHRVVIYAPEYNPDAFPELREGLDIRVVPPRYPFAWTERPKGVVTKIRHKIAQERLHIDTAKCIAVAMDPDFDVLNPHDFAYKVGLFYKKRNPKVRVIWNENDPPFLYLPKRNVVFAALGHLFHWYKHIAERPYLQAVDTVVVLDQWNQRWAARRGLEATVVRSGVDFENFYATVKDISRKGKSVQILGVGALNAYRRYEDIVYAVKCLRSWGYDAKALVICNDIWNEGEYRQYLVDLVRKEKLEPYVDFRFQGVSDEELRRAYHESDVFVLPLYLPPPRNGYGWGLVNFEAMAAGLPLIICRTSTACEVLKDGEHAFFVDPESPEQIAQKVKMIVDDPKLYQAVAGGGQQFVKDHISWGQYAEHILRIFV